MTIVCLQNIMYLNERDSPLVAILASIMKSHFHTVTKTWARTSPLGREDTCSGRGTRGHVAS